MRLYRAPLEGLGWLRSVIDDRPSVHQLPEHSSSYL